MEHTGEIDPDLQGILQDQDERAVSVLGEKFLRDKDAADHPPQTVLALSDKRLYQLGPYYERDASEAFRKVQGTNVVPLSDITEVNTVHMPVSRWISIVGGILLVLGLGILLAGLIDGSGVGLALGLFIGAVWMAVPGGLMLFHARTGGETYLDVTHAGGSLAAPCRAYPENELKAFKTALNAAVHN